MTDALVLLLAAAWIGYTAYYVYARRGAEEVLRRWADATGHRITEVRMAKSSMLSAHRMLHVSMVQRTFEIRVAQKDGSRRVMVVSVGDPWFGSLRDAVTVIEDEGRQVAIPWRGEGGRL